MQKQRFELSLILKGMAMGVAEIIPGVSGGTIAFISGIYERLINSISHFDGESLSLLIKGKFNDLWERIDGFFLLNLFTGMLGGILIGVLAVTHLLENYPPIIWAFFFGLIIGSIIYISRKVKKWDLVKGVIFIVGTGLAYWIVNSPIGNGSEALWYVFLSGVVAISALVLPGISGSFILLLLGMYFYIINDTLKALLHGFSMDKMLVLMVFALGCLAGLMSVVRVLKWAFLKYHDVVLALLVGFMLGSLPKIWPWRNVTAYMDKTDGSIVEGAPEVWLDHFKLISEQVVMPAQYSGGATYFFVSVVSAIIGIGAIILLARYEE